MLALWPLALITVRKTILLLFEEASKLCDIFWVITYLIKTNFSIGLPNFVISLPFPGVQFLKGAVAIILLVTETGTSHVSGTIDCRYGLLTTIPPSTPKEKGRAGAGGVTL